MLRNVLHRDHHHQQQQHNTPAPTTTTTTTNPSDRGNLPPSADPAQPQLQTQGRHDPPATFDTSVPPPDPRPGQTPILKCGPLLRYCGTTYPNSTSTATANGATTHGPAIWRGTVLLVLSGTEDATPVPKVFYSAEVAHRHHNLLARGIKEGTTELRGRTHTDRHGVKRRLVESPPTLILAEEATLFYRYPIEVELEERERPVTYFVQGVEYGDDAAWEEAQMKRRQEEEEESHNNDIDNNHNNNEDEDNTPLNGKPHTSERKEHHHHEQMEDDDSIIRRTLSLPSHITHRTFHVPSSTATMRILFHSCNGFSVGTAEDEWSGPALWNDVLLHHNTHPFHIMIGGGDQIYSDAIRVSGPLQHWASLHNPAKRRRYPFTPDLETRTRRWYRENYIQWFGTYPFAKANGRIPQMNIWDDHDIIDGYGSYTDGFMSCPVFLGVGRAAWRYYMVFQHHTPPQGEAAAPGGEEKSWIVGATPGRYINEPSRSLYARLGPTIAFLGLDARTERTRHQIVTPQTYDLVFRRLEHELDAAHGQVKHLLLLLGVPIAYPRLVWLESLLRSPIAGILRFLNKRFGLAGGMFNKFDGNIDILDDLDDHWCAKVHKAERNAFVARLQELALSRRIRITILSGDVHLAAIGRFYTRPSLLLDHEDPTSRHKKNRTDTVPDPEAFPIAHDHRYMANIISSAITNKPPPPAVAKLLQHRNKIHRFDAHTDERLLEFFDMDVDGRAMMSRVTMARRNYCVISQGVLAPADSGSGSGSSAFANGDPTASHEGWTHAKQRGQILGPGEAGAGTTHPAAHAADAVPPPHPDTSPHSPDTATDALNVAIRVEIDKANRDGRTKSYGFTVPPYIPPQTRAQGGGEMEMRSWG